MNERTPTPILGQAQPQWGPGVVMPDFDSIDPVPRRSFPSPQQVIDDGQRAAPTMHGLIAESLV